MFKKLLVPVDGSKDSIRALERAIDYGIKFQSEIYVLTVASHDQALRVSLDDANYEEFLHGKIIESAKGVLSEAETILTDYPHPFHKKYVIGNPAKEILSFAEKNHVDMIVMGNSGMGAFSRILLGSVSNKVVTSSSVSVLVVKDKKEH